MAPKIDKLSIISSLIIFSIISIPGVYAYYFTDWNNATFLTDNGQRRAHPEFQEDSKIFDKRLMLKKDKSIMVAKNRLVFRGFRDKTIHLDVFLLELDPDRAYPHRISKADARKGIRLGDSRFKLLDVSRNTLQLEILDLFKS